MANVTKNVEVERKQNKESAIILDLTMEEDGAMESWWIQNLVNATPGVVVSVLTISIYHSIFLLFRK